MAVPGDSFAVFLDEMTRRHDEHPAKRDAKAEERVLAALANAAQPLTLDATRSAADLQVAVFTEALQRLLADKRVVVAADGRLLPASARRSTRRSKHAS